MRYSFLVLLVFFFVGCSTQKVETPDEHNITIQDLVTIPQDIDYYTSQLENEPRPIADKYDATYFNMWNIEKPEQTLEDIQWPFRAFDLNESYGENFLPLKQSFFDEQYSESNFDEYLSLSKKAVTLKYTNIRALPTERPLLMDPTQAGEGLPFDYLQNSSINANTPVFASHYSLDKQWVFIFSSITYGWVKSSDLVFIDDTYTVKWKNAKLVKITTEGVPLFTEKNKALFRTRVGMMFALIGEEEENYIILTVSKYKENEPLFHQTKISKNIATTEFLTFNKENISRIIKEISKTNYGWGGVYGQRDCSSTLMDFYAPFGVFLPRNSSKQSEIGNVVSFEGLSSEEKEKLIKEKAIPFKTLLYRKGHIVMFVGLYKGEIIVYHNTWGIRTLTDGEEGRFIIGKTIFSTLKPGKELPNYDKSSELLKNLKSMNTVAR